MVRHGAGVGRGNAMGHSLCRERRAWRDSIWQGSADPMTYYFATTIDVAFEEAVQTTTERLKEEGFGIVSQIDMKQTLKAKLGIGFRDYRILGACNPQLAYEALQIEDKVGTMLPCNVIVQDVGGGRTEIAAIDPLAQWRRPRTPG